MIKEPKWISLPEDGMIEDGSFKPISIVQLLQLLEKEDIDLKIECHPSTGIYNLIFEKEYFPPITEVANREEFERAPKTRVCVSRPVSWAIAKVAYEGALELYLADVIQEAIKSIKKGE